MIELIGNFPLIDAAINSTMPYETYGDYYALFLGSYMGSSIYRSLLKFPLPALPVHSRIAAAEIVFYIIRNDNTSYPKEFKIYRVTEDFNENTVHYANQPSFDADSYQAFIIHDEINTTIKIDITELFLGWRNSKYPNHGILIKASNENVDSLVAFYSKDSEKALFYPKLQISFEKTSQNILDAGPDSTKDGLKTTEDYYNMGNQYYESGFFEKAYECYKEAFKDFPPNARYGPKLLFRFVCTLDKLYKYEEALETIEYRLNYYHQFTDLEFLRADLYRKLEKPSLAIKGYQKCIQMGDPPIKLSFISGAGSYQSYDALSKIYYDLGDYDEAYTYGSKALSVNPNFTDPLFTIGKILADKAIELNDIPSKLESFLGTNLVGRDYLVLADLFFKLKRYNTAYEYFIKAESFFQNNGKLLYYKGMCLLYQKNYEEAYASFEKINSGEFYEDAIYKMILCQILKNDMKKASELLNFTRDPESNDLRLVYYTFKNLLEDKHCPVISDDKNESIRFLDIIFSLLDVVLKAAPPEVFEKSLHLLNLIENDEVLLRLGKLYYNNELYQMSYEELVRSLKLFNRMDIEGLNMMKKVLSLKNM